MYRPTIKVAREEFASNKDAIAGLQIITSGYSFGEVPISVINDALKLSGFDDDEALIPQEKPSTLYFDVIRKLNQGRTNLRKRPFIYQLNKLVHDLTNQGKVVHSVLKITKSVTEEHIDSEETFEVARITYKCDKVGTEENNPTVSIEIAEGAESDIPILKEIVDLWNDKRDERYDTSRIISLINKQCLNYFKGYRLRESGGVYFINRHRIDSFLNFAEAINTVAPEIQFLPTLIYKHSPSAMNSCAASVSEEILKDFKRNADKWGKKVQEAKDAGKEHGEGVFRVSSLLTALQEAKEMHSRASQAASDLEFDMEQVSVIKEELDTLILQAQKYSKFG